MRTHLDIWLALLGMLVLAGALTLVGYLSVACHAPVAMLAANAWIAPLSGIAGGALYIGSSPGRRHSWRDGVLLALGAVLLNLLIWCFVRGRWSAAAWWRHGVLELTLWHAVAWGGALLAGGLAGGIGGRLGRLRWWGLSSVLALALLLNVACAYVLPRDAVRQEPLAAGVTLQRTPFDAEGTAVTLITADFARNPHLALAVYDQGQQDDAPGTDWNTTWLGSPLQFTWPRICRDAGRQGGRALCACNGDFFTFDRWWQGWHLAPFVTAGRVAYQRHDAASFSEQDWQFGVRRVGSRAAFCLAKSFTPAEWRGGFEMAIGAVRPLCINGVAQPLPPGRGNTGLRCARTSFGWSADSARWYLLIVQDLDGENASIQQKRHNPATQTGGMNLPQLQAFWLQHHVPNAVILDGGDSTQYADDSGRRLCSGYLCSCTLGYFHRRPLRCFAPLLPPLQDHIGVMNYMYLLEQ